MADAEHLAILAKGTETWNSWRAQAGSEIAPNLYSATLTDLDLTNVDFRNVVLSNAILQNVKLSGAMLMNADLARSLLENCEMSGADLSGATLTESMILFSSFERASIESGGFMWAHVAGSNFSGARLDGSMLSWAIFNRVDLKRASLLGADLTLASFLDSDLEGADFSDSRMGWTTFASITLVSARGLDLARHTGPSSLSLQTFAQRSNLPSAFLRGIGLSDSAIEHASQLSPKDFHSCFISYSTKDQILADKLYKDLQENRVRCWLATEDLKIGEQFRSKIDQSILSHDKLLIILSHDSVESRWVGSEVEAAFEKERRIGLSVLFPIRLDDAVMDCQQAWAAEIRRTRHIGDFRSWHDPGVYEKALRRLLRDLKAQ